ncbi:hypothetical protein [Sporosalibacterium faouarense]|uniref:hypothetical protein n=1 Tax=Sporosalibacterium faouarense TaxID=516123 RepID=UPI00192ACB53|nr:hypothetical protein [Sporosalibacterium faouarense]
MKRYIMLIVLVIIEVYSYFRGQIEELETFFFIWAFIGVFITLMIFIDWGNETPNFTAEMGTSKESYMLNKKNSDSKIVRKTKGLIGYISFILINGLGTILTIEGII